MGAKKSKASRSSRLEQARFRLARPARIRDPLPVIVVVCDDAVAAPNYFQEISRKLKAHVTLRVEHSRRNQTSSREVAGRAIAKLRELKRASSTDDRTSVWALIDLEADHSRQQLACAAKAMGKKAGVRVALSLPCFEVWTLLHFEDTGEAFLNCKSVAARIKQHVEAFDKVAVDYSRIVEDRRKASVRARLHHERNDPSWTEIYLVIDEIDGCVSPPRS